LLLLTNRTGPSGVVGALPLSREARVQFPAGELGSHQISPDGARAGNLVRPQIGWGLPLVPDSIQSWRFREVCARKSRGPSLHRLGKIDAICTCIDTSDVKLMEFQDKPDRYIQLSTAPVLSSMTAIQLYRNTFGHILPFMCSICGVNHRKTSRETVTSLRLCTVILRLA